MAERILDFDLDDYYVALELVATDFVSSRADALKTSESWRREDARDGLSSREVLDKWEAARRAGRNRFDVLFQKARPVLCKEKAPRWQVRVGVPVAVELIAAVGAVVGVPPDGVRILLHICALEGLDRLCRRQ